MTLLERARRGELAALRQLVRVHSERLLRVARIRSREPRRAVPEGRLWSAVERRLAERLASLAPVKLASLLDLLAGIVQEELGRLLEPPTPRQGAPARAVPRAPEPVPRRVPARTELELFPPADAGLPQERALRRALDELVRDLPERQREAVLLLDYCGVERAEAARTIGCSEAEVEACHRDAWCRLRDALHDRLEVLL